MTALPHSERSKAFWHQMGFNTATMPHLFRTAIGACIAMMLGIVLGLDHPQWAAMSVWAASQPFRGQVLEKGGFRMLGSAFGVVAGVAFVMLSKGSPLAMMLMISAWSTLCVLLAHMARGYTSYGFLLAGYSAAMVGLLDFDHPHTIMHLGADRLATVALGVVIATLTALLFAPKSSTQNHMQRTLALCGNVLDELVRDISRQPADEAQMTALLSEAAGIEETLDGNAAGSLRHRRSARAQRRLLLQLVHLIIWINRPNSPDDADEIALVANIDQARTALLSNEAEPAIYALRKAASQASSRHLCEALEQLAHAIGPICQTPSEVIQKSADYKGPRLHRDRVGAREAAIRTGAMMLLMGSIWAATGWVGGPYLMLGASIMTTVFSVMDAPVRTMPYILRGVLLGVAAAFVCRWLIWPMVVVSGGGSIALAAAAVPFILLGPLFMTHKKTAEGAFDYNMHLLLLLSPLLPLTGTVGHWWQIALAIFIGPSSAWLAYKFIFPATLDRRLQNIARMMVNDVRAMARGDAETSLRRATIWRTRLEHRILQLSRWVDKTSTREISATGGAMATVLLGEATLRLHEMARSPDERLAKSAHLSLNRISHLDENTTDAEHALYRTANMDAISASDRHLLMHAIKGLADHPAFFAKAA